MSSPKETSKPARPATFLAFLITCLAHAIMIFAVAWVMRERVGAIEWEIEWVDAAILGLVAVSWRVWLRPRT